MAQKQINLSTVALAAIVGVLAFIVVGQFFDAQSELETSRASCYANAGKEVCESHNVR